MCDCDCELTKRETYAIDMGRDCLREGLVPFLTRLVGEANARSLVAELQDDAVREYRFG